MQAARILSFLAICSSLACQAEEAADWVLLGDAQLQGVLKPVEAKSYIKPSEIEEKSGLRYVEHRMVFKRAQASINRKYIKEVREAAVVSCQDQTVGVVSADLLEPNGSKLTTKIIAKKGLEMALPENDHHRRLIDTVCKIEISAKE